MASKDNARGVVLPFQKPIRTEKPDQQFVMPILTPGLVPSDPMVDAMKRRGMRLTVANYLRYAFPEPPPDPLPGELYETIPFELLTDEPPADEEDA